MQLPTLLSTLLFLLTPFVFSTALPGPEPEVLNTITLSGIAAANFVAAKHIGKRDSGAPSVKIYEGQDGGGKMIGSTDAKTNKCYTFRTIPKMHSFSWDLGKKSGVKVQRMLCIFRG